MALQEVMASASILFQRISGLLNPLVIVLVILLFGFILGKILDRVLRRLLADLRVDEVFTRWRGARRNYARAIRHTIVRAVYICTFLFALYSVSLLRVFLILLVAFAALALLVSALLAARDLVPNALGGIALRKRGISVGDSVLLLHEFGTVSGTVVRIGAFLLRVRRQNGDLLIIPNAGAAAARIIRRLS